jgi:hypothetical protein
MEHLRRMVGLERSLAEVAQALHFDAKQLAASSVGAVHVTCADESERECVEALQSGFVRFLLPSLKFAHQSAFRIANLGGRYEWGAVRIAEDHFATGSTAGGFNLLVVKINAHVAAEETASGFRFGTWKRYDRDSTCCGALHALLGGSTQPFAVDLRELFESEGRERLAELADPRRVDPQYRYLFAALLSARLQARKAVMDVQDFTPRAPTCFLLLPCVTMNRAGRDGEIVCGMYTVDGREGGREATYYGLGDDPAAYEVGVRHGLLEVSDDQVGLERRGRDHRKLALEEWRRRSDAGIRVHDPRLDRVRQDVARNRHRDHKHARALLRTALPVLAEVAPVPAAIVMFAQGAGDIHHAFRVHRLSKELEGTAEARRILDEIHERVDTMEPERAEALIELLVRDYAR